MSGNLELVKTIVETIEKIVTAFGIVGGAFWAYYKYLRGRIFRNRLETSISGSYVEGTSNLILTIKLKNIGASDIPLRQQGTAAIVETLINESKVTDAITSGETIVVEILKDHEWIEPSETIREQHFVHLPAPGPKALRLRLRVVSQGKSFSKRTAWTCISIALPQPTLVNGASKKE